MADRERFHPLFERWARSVRGRLLARRVLTGLAVGLALAVVPAFFAWRTRHGALRPLCALGGLVGVVAGVVVARRRRWTDVDVALWLDDRLETEEAITTAVELRNQAEDDDEARAVVVNTAATVLAEADGKRARPAVLRPLQLLAPIAAAALVFVARSPLPAAPAQPQSPGETKVQLAQVEGLKKVAQLGEANARDEAQKERLEAMAKDAEKLRADLEKGLEKREAHDRIAKLRDEIAAERLTLGEGEQRAGLEAAMSEARTERRDEGGREGARRSRSRDDGPRDGEHRERARKARPRGGEEGARGGRRGGEGERREGRRQGARGGEEGARGAREARRGAPRSREGDEGLGHGEPGAEGRGRGARSQGQRRGREEARRRDGQGAREAHAGGAQEARREAQGAGAQGRRAERSPAAEGPRRRAVDARGAEEARGRAEGSRERGRRVTGVEGPEGARRRGGRRGRRRGRRQRAEARPEAWRERPRSAGPGAAGAGSGPRTGRWPGSRSGRRQDADPDPRTRQRQRRRRRPGRPGQPPRHGHGPAQREHGSGERDTLKSRAKGPLNRAPGCPDRRRDGPPARAAGRRTCRARAG